METNQSINMETEDERGLININRIVIKAPPFWPKEPELWFAQIESEFTLNRIIQDATKYGYVLLQLKAKYAKEIKNVVANPPESNKYQTFKQALTQRLSASQEQRIRQLLEHEELGDRKPSNNFFAIFKHLLVQPFPINSLEHSG